MLVHLWRMNVMILYIFVAYEDLAKQRGDSKHCGWNISVCTRRWWAMRFSSYTLIDNDLLGRFRKTAPKFTRKIRNFRSILILDIRNCLLTCTQQYTMMKNTFWDINSWKWTHTIDSTFAFLTQSCSARMVYQSISCFKPRLVGHNVVYCETFRHFPILYVLEFLRKLFRDPSLEFSPRVNRMNYNWTFRIPCSDVSQWALFDI